MGCSVCNSHHPTEECPMLVDGTRITDSILPQRAFLTLPKNLESRALDEGRFDIISTSDLPRGTQFGPFLAPKYKRLNSSCAYQLPIFRGNRILHFLDTTNLSKCNWMSLVRFTNDETKRNTICYQLKDEIYFSVVIEIKESQPLLVCYSPGYFSLLQKIKECASRNLTLHLQSETVKTDVQKHTDLLQLEQTSDTVVDHDYFTSTSPSTIINDAGDNEPFVKKVTNNFSTLSVVGTRSSKRLKKRKMLSARLRKRTLVPPVKVEEVKIIKDNKEDSTLNDRKDGKRQKRRICYPIRDTEMWECKFCHVQMNVITNFAQHLIEHYKCFKSIEDKLGKKEEEIEPSLLQPTLPYTCDICRKIKSYTRLETVIRHLRIAHGSISKNAIAVNHDYIQCHGCRQYFGNENFYSNHTCEEPSVNGCCICNIVFENRMDLRNHLSTHTENDFICPDCRKILTNVSYEIHISVCRTARNALDDLALGNINCCWKGCQEELLDLQSFQTHFAEHTHPFLCSKCFLRLRNPKELNTHRCKKLMCDKCLRVFDTVPQLKDHINQDHSNLSKVLSCFECTKPFATLEGYVKHEDCEEASRLAVFTGNQSSTDENLDVKYVCEFCGATYSNMSSLKTHRNTHLEKKFVCKKCNKRFTRKALLQDHYHVHTDPQFSCLICDSKLKTLKSLTVHMRIHKESKPFICAVCGKGFAQKINLQTHSRSHIPAEEKRHEICDQCGKKFFSPEYLKLHAKTHETNGEKFACDICKAEFLRPYILHQHKKTVHGNNVYKCEFCERNVRFRQKYSLHRHWMKEHPNDKDTWEAEGYISSMLIPGDGSLCHPRTKKTPTLSQTQDEHTASTSSESNAMKCSNVSHTGKTRQSAKRSKKVNLDIGINKEVQIVSEQQPMPENLEIENEVIVGEEDSSKSEFTLTLDDETTDLFSKTISHPNMKPENLILLQLDDDGRYVIAFSPI